MKPPIFTDKGRFNLPYVSAEQSKAEGYLSARFKLYREQQMRDEQERRDKVRQVKRS